MVVSEKKPKADAGYEPVIGLETHIQLSTSSKMFCSCSANYRGAEPNTQVCPVCAGLPGALPTVNRRAVEYAIMIATALGCSIAADTRFDRKNYLYPDLMKGYQISQADHPIGHGGKIEIAAEGQDKPATIRINRVHMEEDVAKLHHHSGYALMDLNRAGVPLMEVVTEPDFRTPEQATAYIEELQRIIRFIGVGTANMEDGSFRCDANISIRPAGSSKLGTKVEVKNMNRIGAVARALKYEIARHQKTISGGGKVVQETRGWSDEGQKTVSQRLKEESSDYRYFPEPDIPPLRLEAEFIDEVRSNMPPLPAALAATLEKDLLLSAYDARLLTTDPQTYRYFTESLEAGSKLSTSQRPEAAKALANWINGEMARLRHEGRHASIYGLKIKPLHFAGLVDKFRRKELNNNSAKRVLEQMAKSGRPPEEIIEELGLRSVADAGLLQKLAAKLVGEHPKAVKDYHSGNQAAVQFLMGQMMKETRGQADPKAGREAIMAALAQIRK